MQRALRGQMELLDQMVWLGHEVKKRRGMKQATAEMRPIEGEIYLR
jgi:hypothetical protein